MAKKHQPQSPNFFAFNVNVKKEYDFKTSLDTTGKWIKYGNDNLLPFKFIDLLENSPLHSGILEKKADYTAGQGLEFTDPLFEKWATEECNLTYGLHNLIHRCARDLHLYGGFCVQVIWYTYQRKIKDIIYQDFSEVRRGFEDKADINGLYQQGIWLSADWRQRYKFKPEFYEMFNKEVFYGEAPIPEKPVFLYYYREAPGKKWYPIPTYYSAILAIRNEIELINFMNSNITQSFNPSGLLKLPAILSPDEQQQFKEKVIKEMSGTDNAGKIFTVFADGDKSVEWIPLNNTPNDKSVTEYLDLNERLIVVAHQVPSPTLVGLPSMTGFSSEGELLKQASKEFFDKVIMKAQNEILHQLNPLIKMAGFNQDIIIKQNIPTNE